MSTNITAIVEVKKGGKWQRVNTELKSLDDCGYPTYALLADVENVFSIKHFPVKDLPEDMSAKKFGFNSYTKKAKKEYESGKVEERARLQDGSIVAMHSPKLQRECSEEEYENSTASRGCRYKENERVYYICDPEANQAEVLKLPLNQIYSTYEEYWENEDAQLYRDEYVEEEKDYGYYDIDFTMEDYFCHSYLTLKELHEFDYSDYMSARTKVSKPFYDEFIKRGGVLPEGMEAIVDRAPSDMIDAMRYVMCPDVIVKWPSEDGKGKPFFKVIEELEQLAKEHQVAEDEIRMIFMFG